MTIAPPSGGSLLDGNSTLALGARPGRRRPRSGSSRPSSTRPPRATPAGTAKGPRAIFRGMKLTGWLTGALVAGGVVYHDAQRLPVEGPRARRAVREPARRPVRDRAQERRHARARRAHARPLPRQAHRRSARRVGRHDRGDRAHPRRRASTTRAPASRAIACASRCSRARTTGRAFDQRGQEDDRRPRRSSSALAERLQRTFEIIVGSDRASTLSHIDLPRRSSAR